MIIIDLRPYENDPPTEPILDIVKKHFNAIKGATQIIYEVPDEIWISYKQKYLYFPLDECIHHISTKRNIPLVIKDSLAKEWTI